MRINTKSTKQFPEMAHFGMSPEQPLYSESHIRDFNQLQTGMMVNVHTFRTNGNTRLMQVTSPVYNDENSIPKLDLFNFEIGQMVSFNLIELGLLPSANGMWVTGGYLEIADQQFEA